MKKIKDKIITFGFVILIGVVFILNLLIKDKDVSSAERRNLAQFPEVTVDTLLSGSVSQELEKYAMDQFILRDKLRSLKAYVNLNVLGYRDNNKLFVEDNAIYKIEYPLNENNVKKSAMKIKDVYNKYLKGMNVYYAIIPDKNYYLETDEYLKMDYLKLKSIVTNELKNMKYIDIWNTLSINDYYKTDTHWKHENLNKVIDIIKKEMNLETKSTYRYTNLGEFYGVYYGQLGLNTSPDTIHIATNSEIQNATTYNVETNKYGSVYDMDKFKNSIDKYDVYLSGATPIITITNKEAKENKELLLFRDSFGSSIGPLFLDNYSKITLIDIRYVSSSLLSNYIDFNNQDVLFLYSTLVLNQNILK